MKKILSFLFVAMVSSGAFAQEAFISTTMLTISPTILTAGLFGEASESLGISALLIGASTFDIVDEKGNNAKNELREESSIAAALLLDGKKVALKEFKTLSAMIDELKYNEMSKLEIEAAANKAQVSFEVMAIKQILLITE